MVVLRRRLGRFGRRGQSEVIGGLIVLTLIFMFAVPVILNMYYANVQAGQQAQARLSEVRTSLNEKLAVGPVNPNSEAAQRAGWVPGVWINNTGTVTVQLDKLYLIDDANNTIFAIYDLRYARPINTSYIKEMLLNPDEGSPRPIPPPGEPISLKPGDKLLIVFNESILPYAPNLIVLVESSSGILHPISSATSPPILYPGRPGGTSATGGWRGIFQPQSGFSVRGYDELAKNGITYAWKPPYFVFPSSRVRSNAPEDLSYYHSFIYDDPDYPGLYMVDIQLRESTWLIIYFPNGVRYPVFVDYGYTIVLKGYLGTYDAGNGGSGTYFSGYATEVRIYNENGDLVFQLGPEDNVYLGDNGITRYDFDGNGIDEIVYYDYLNGPTIPPSYRVNIDADNDGSYYRDALAWTYMIARDISGIDYVKITVKINYYWTRVVGPDGCPDWAVRNLKVFSVVVWKYNEQTQEWEVYQFQNFGYTSEKPVQFQKTVVFPVERNGTYRVGVIFYDNYRDFDYGYDCWTDFTLGLEHMIVEYGIYNPYFVESPPLYIIAIPNPDLIGEIGEEEYMAVHNISDIDLAKVRAQADLLAKIKEELNYAGVAGYTIITDPTQMCDLLFGDQPPKYAIIFWLQGNVSISRVAAEAGCSITNNRLAQYMSTYHWVLVWAFGEPFGDRNSIGYYNNYVIIDPPSNVTMNITSAGVKVRKDYYAYYLYNQLTFKYPVWFASSQALTDYMIVNATFYSTTGDYTADSKYGTVSFWLDNGQGTGIVVLNPVHVDWDLSGDGASPQSIAQQIVYSSLISWSKVTGG